MPSVVKYFPLCPVCVGNVTIVPHSKSTLLLETFKTNPLALLLVVSSVVRPTVASAGAFNGEGKPFRCISTSESIGNTEVKDKVVPDTV